MSLLCKFVKAGVNKKNIWKLDDKFLDDAQLTAIQKLKYRRAKESLFGPGRINYHLPLKAKEYKFV